MQSPLIISVRTKCLSINVCDIIAMWSSIIIFILTFAVLGLLLGFASVYTASPLKQNKSTVPQGNSTASNITQAMQNNNSTGNMSSGSTAG